MTHPGSLWHCQELHTGLKDECLYPAWQTCLFLQLHFNKMPVGVSIVKRGSSLCLKKILVNRNNEEYSWLRYELHKNCTIFYPLTLLGTKYILRRLLGMSYLTEMLVNLCRVFRLWCFMEYIPETSVLVFEEKVQLIWHPQNPPTLQLNKRTESLPKVLNVHVYPLPLYNLK